MAEHAESASVGKVSRATRAESAGRLIPVLLQHIRLVNVRCHRSIEIELGPGLTVLVGPNGTGKTTVLEAIYLLFRGGSPRTAQPRELITRTETVLRVEGDLTSGPPDGGVDARLGAGSGGNTVAALGYGADGERRMTAGGAPLTDALRWDETFPVRMFLPDDLRLVKGSPRRRRLYLDGLASTVWPPYRQSLSRYEEALQQRNTLLRAGVTGAEHAPWEALLAREGLTVVLARARALQTITAVYTATHRTLAAGAGAATLSYRTNVADCDEPAYRDRLAAHRGTDRQRTFTHSGPHRDDMRFLLDGRDLRDYGSQGEQRTAVLALLLAERAWRAQEGGVVPMLLLDDVMSELDADRRRALMGLLAGSGQTVLTTTDLHYFTTEELAGLTVVGLGEERCL
jgi:DNA replication and repair protein RecF